MTSPLATALRATADEIDRQDDAVNFALNEAGKYNTLTRTRWGLMLCHKNDHYIGQSLQTYGDFSLDEVAFLVSLLDRGDAVIDGGANVGALTLPMAAKVGFGGAVIALEPQRPTFHVLCGNVALFNVDWIVSPRQLALGAEPGKLELPMIDLNKGINVGGLGRLPEDERRQIPDERIYKVPITTVDEIAEPLDDLKLLKLDIEGMEPEALDGAMDTLARLQPYVYAETDRPGSEAEVRKRLEPLGYKCFKHHPPLFSPANYRGASENIFPHTVSINLLGVPVSRETPDPGHFGLVPCKEMADG